MRSEAPYHRFHYRRGFFGALRRGLPSMLSEALYLRIRHHRDFFGTFCRRFGKRRSLSSMLSEAPYPRNHHRREIFGSLRNAQKAALYAFRSAIPENSLSPRNLRSAVAGASECAEACLLCVPKRHTLDFIIAENSSERFGLRKGLPSMLSEAPYPRIWHHRECFGTFL